MTKCPKCGGDLKNIWLSGGMAGEILGEICKKCESIFYRGKDVTNE